MNNKSYINTQNLQGKVFGRLTVLKIESILSGSQIRKKAFCKCNCGNEKHIDYDSLRKGSTNSCGCLASENRLLAVTHYKYNSNFFKNHSEEMYYILGLLYSDGSLSNRRFTFSISLQNQDNYILEKIGLLLRNSNVLYNPKDKNVSTLFCTCKEMYKDLLNLGLYPNKSTTLQVPSLLKFNRHFWRGMIDGDGSLFTSNKSLHLSLCGTKDICDSFKEWVLSLGAITKSNSRSKKGYSFDFREIQFGTKTSMLISNEIYKDNPVLKLERKYNNYINYINEKKINKLSN